jgi:hypothetical protein
MTIHHVGCVIIPFIPSFVYHSIASHAVGPFFLSMFSFLLSFHLFAEFVVSSVLFHSSIPVYSSSEFLEAHTKWKSENEDHQGKLLPGVQ